MDVSVRFLKAFYLNRLFHYFAARTLIISAAEGGQILGLARRDQVAVDNDFGILKDGPSVYDIVLDGEKAGGVPAPSKCWRSREPSGPWQMDATSFPSYSYREQIGWRARDAGYDRARNRPE